MSSVPSRQGLSSDIPTSSAYILFKKDVPAPLACSRDRHLCQADCEAHWPCPESCFQLRGPVPGTLPARLFIPLLDGASERKRETA